jgi:hypothetical protein
LTESNEKSIEIYRECSKKNIAEGEGRWLNGAI